MPFEAGRDAFGGIPALVRHGQAYGVHPLNCGFVCQHPQSVGEHDTSQVP